MAGTDPKPVLRDGVPVGLVQPLRNWLESVFSNAAHGEALATLICLRLDIGSDAAFGYTTSVAALSKDNALLQIGADS